MYKPILPTVLAVLGIVAMPLNNSINEKYHTGYIKPNIEYPPQPVKLMELENIVNVKFSGKQAYPLRRVCEALGYNVVWDDGLITINKDEETHIIDTNDNTELKIIDNTSYAASSLFYTLFSMSFRYSDDIGVLEIFNKPK